MLPCFAATMSDGEAGFVRRLHRGAGVNELAHDFPFLFQGGGNHRVRAAENAARSVRYRR